MDFLEEVAMLRNKARDFLVSEAEQGRMYPDLYDAIKAVDTSMRGLKDVPTRESSEKFQARIDVVKRILVERVETLERVFNSHVQAVIKVLGPVPSPEFPLAPEYTSRPV